ncbi:MAG: sugar nucleotide-binding protein, partial [Bacteroidota bacterium]|nr:sugar nucleotide-binding protein [Bacteroidota bacterium]
MHRPRGHKRKKILLLGASGQVGWELQKLLPALGEVQVCARNNLDLTDLDAIRRTVAAYQPDCIVNAAAYTAVDKAQSESKLAHRINAEAVAVLAKESKERDTWLIHYSTDYVFDGT